MLLYNVDDVVLFAQLQPQLGALQEFCDLKHVNVNNLENPDKPMQI